MADDITKEAKQIYNKEWEGSPARSFLNILRKHLRGDEFGQDWDNGLLSSIAAVLIKGDDWEKLLHFMQSQKMSDYRIAFSLYGLLTGFANLTRDFTDILLNEPQKYVKDVYTEFYGQLFGKKIKTEKRKKSTIKKGNLSKDPDLFDSFKQPLFVDSSPDDIINSISGSDEFKEKIKKNLTTFFDLYKRGGYYEKNKNNRNNANTVNHFIRSCCSEKTTLPNKFNGKDPLIQKLKEELSVKYHD